MSTSVKAKSRNGILWSNRLGIQIMKQKVQIILLKCATDKKKQPLSISQLLYHECHPSSRY